MIHHEPEPYRSHFPVIVGAIVLIILGNAFLYFYSGQNNFRLQPLPYFEDFSSLDEIDYRLIGDGSWTITEEQLIQQDPTQSEIIAVIPGIDLEEEQSYKFSANMNVLEGPKGGGLVFNIQNGRSVANSQMIRMGNSEGSDFLVYGYFDSDQVYVPQGSVRIENVGQEFALGVEVSDPNYTVLINDQVIAADIPLQHKGGSLAVASWNSKVAFDNVSVLEPGSAVPVIESQPAAPIIEPPSETVVVETPATVEDVQPVEVIDVVPDQPGPVVQDEPVQVVSVPVQGELPYFEDFTEDENHNFNVLTGEWELRNGQLTQTNPRVSDVTAAIPGISMAPDQVYDFSTNFDVLDGPHGAGLMFNMQQPDSIAESHMMRLGSNADGGKYLIYGFFDAERRFNWQGDAQPLPFNSQGKLGVSVEGNNFSVLMNDQVLVENIPLVYKGGRAGVTTWNSSVAFDSFSLFDPRTGGLTVVEPPIEVVQEAFETTLPWLEDFTGDEDHAFIDVGGNWQLREETMLQLNTEVSDVLAILPGLTLSSEESYDFTTDIKILEGPKGGGIAFNVQNIDSIRESHLVRFGTNDGNDYMIYGFFDENRSFNVQGSVIPSIEDEAKLGVSVSGTSYDILINDEVVARDIPLTYLGGRAALSTWNSSIVFDNIAVTSPFSDEIEATDIGEDEAGGEQPVAATEASAEAAVSEETSEAPAEAQFFAEALNAETDQSAWSPSDENWAFGENGITHPEGPEEDQFILNTNNYDRFNLSTTMRMGAGSGGSGILFNAPSADTVAGSHVVKYQSNEVVSWGYYAEDGSYVEQGITIVLPSGTEEQSISVQSDGAGYSIFLGDEQIAENQELISTGGRVGFITNAREVSYSAIEISPLESASTESE
ncbi:MAG: hypothetical protein AAGD96_23300 [Chloroflexota bacterium]